MGIVSLLTDASSEMVYPVLPLFASSVLGAPAAAIGLIESLAEATAAFSKLASGWFSDLIGRRKPLVVAGYSLSNFAKPLLAATTSWSAVLVLKVTDRMGKGVRTAPRDALIAESSAAVERGRAFGLHRALDTIGAAIGPLIAWGVLTVSPDAYRTIFLVSAIPGLAAIVVLLVAVRETGARARATAAGGLSGPSAGAGEARPPRVSFADFTGPLIAFTAISFVFGVANSSDAFLILRAQDLGAPAALIPLMYVAFNVVGAALSTPFGARSDAIGRRRMLVFGFAGYAAVYLGFALAEAQAHAWALFALYGIPYAATEGMTRAYVVDLAGEERRATVLGAYTFVLGISALVSSTLAGVLWDRVSHAAPFAVSAALMALAAAVLVGLGGWMERERVTKLP